MDTKELIDRIMEDIDAGDRIHARDIPDISLYMDQVTTFMDSHLKKNRRHPEDKIFTKTMINNYAKNHLVPPPEKKKYTREHMLLLVMIYYLKGFLSIGDINALLSPLTERYFHEEKGVTLAGIYEEILRMEEEQAQHMRAEVDERFSAAAESFSDAPEEDRKFLQTFAFISLLSFDVYRKKQLIERLIDQLKET